MYAIAYANGPISAAIPAGQNAAEYVRDNATAIVDGCRTDAEDQLGFSGEGLTAAEFADALQSRGLRCIDGNLTGDHNWSLWTAE
jgi:hypothetical protein